MILLRAIPNKLKKTSVSYRTHRIDRQTTMSIPFRHLERETCRKSQNEKKKIVCVADAAKRGRKRDDTWREEGVKGRSAMT